MNKLNALTIIFLLLLSCGTISCKKQLEAKPDLHLTTPHTLADLQALLDYTPYMYAEPAAAETSCDNYFVPDVAYNALSQPIYQSLYTWEKDHLFDGPISDWGTAYRKIYYCNVVLDALPNIADGSAAEWNDIRAQALFKRAKTFWHVANIWALTYDSSSAATDLGIPLRLNADFNEVSTRASVQQSYTQIINDLKSSIAILPITALHVVRPSRPAAYAMLSRVYLSMRKYAEAGLYADSALLLNNALMDYNSISNTPAYPFSNPNAEVLLASSATHTVISINNGRIDSNLYASYSVNDLRKTLYFKSLGGNQYSFRGNYTNTSSQFSGLATDELYLTRAECRARAGNIPAALADLNYLLVRRFKTGTFVPVTASSAADALNKILTERRKELVMRFVRWMDLKRLNKEGAAITLKRFVNGTAYELPPNDLRYALALPEDVLALSGMPQNPR